MDVIESKKGVPKQTKPDERGKKAKKTTEYPDMGGKTNSKECFFFENKLAWHLLYVNTGE